MSMELFHLELVYVTHAGYRMVLFSLAATSITPISFLVAGMGDYADLERSYLEWELRLHSTATNDIVANANSALDANNTKFTYVTNNESLPERDRYECPELQPRRRGDFAGTTRLGERFQCGRIIGQDGQRQRRHHHSGLLTQ